MKCFKCKKELIGYQASDYPFDNGYKCNNPKCEDYQRQWSRLQIASKSLEENNE